MQKRAFGAYPMNDLERAITMNPNVNVGPTVSLGMPGQQSSFAEHEAFQNYVNQIRQKAVMEAEMQATGQAEAGSRQNLLGLSALGGLGGGLIGYHQGGNLAAAMPAAGLGAALGAVAGLSAPSGMGGMSMGAGLGAIPGAYLGKQLGKQYPKYALPALIAGLLGGAGIGGVMGR